MAPIGRRAEVRSIARLEPPVPGRASHGKLLRLRVATFEAPKLVRAKQRATHCFSPSFPLFFTFLPPSCRPSSLSTDGDIPCCSRARRDRDALFVPVPILVPVPFFLRHIHILVSLSVAPEIARQVRDAVVFFRQSSRAARLYESLDRRRVSLRAFIVTEPFCVPRAVVYPVPLLLLFEDFSSASCEIARSPRRSSSFLVSAFSPPLSLFLFSCRLIAFSSTC